MAKNKFSVWWIVVFGLCFMFSSVLVFFKSKRVENEERLKILCTTFPIYDWTRHIIGEDSETIVLSMLEKNGINYHTFVPSVTDLQQIKNSQLFVCIGTEKEYQEIVREDILYEMDFGTSRKILNLSDVAKTISFDCFEKDNEHIWLSIKNAKIFTKLIAEKIEELDYSNKDKYEKNLQKYLTQLDSIDDEYREVFSENNIKPLILCDKNPFYWLFTDYSVNFYAALSECNESLVLSGALEKFVGSEIIHLLTEKMDDSNISVIFKLDNSTDKFAYQILKDSKSPLGDIIALDTMHAVTLSEALKGKSYVKVMRENLEKIKKAL